MVMNTTPARARAHPSTNLHTAATTSRQPQLAAQSHTALGATHPYSLVACQSVCCWPHNQAATPTALCIRLRPVATQEDGLALNTGPPPHIRTLSGPHPADPWQVVLHPVATARLALWASTAGTVGQSDHILLQHTEKQGCQTGQVSSQSSLHAWQPQS